MQKSSENKIYTVIGLMSGTAMDGIDAAAIETNGYSYIKPLGFVSEPHTPELREQLRSCLNKIEKTRDVKDVERDFTKAHTSIINNLINKINKNSQDIDFIGFHGQTIHHDPDNGVTIQLGDGDLLAAETDINVINDFRSNDMTFGGQGAPLIPVYHRALIQNAGLELPAVILNLGGVANITYLSNDDMIGFDTGPANAMIDDWIKKHTGLPYDDNGEIASKGDVNQAALEAFLSSSYFLEKYPKSLDRNNFSDICIDSLSLEDGARTLTEMTVQSVALGIKQCPQKPHAIYVTGGGRHNKFMMERLYEVTQTPIHMVDELGWNGDAMEAEGFAYMAVRSYLNEPISFPGTTGCQKPVTGGVIHKSPQAHLGYYLDQWDLRDPVKVDVKSEVSDVYIVTQNDGSKAALKILKERGVWAEAAAPKVLKSYNANGSVNLLKSDKYAHLLEYLSGEMLSIIVKNGDDDKATHIVVDIIKNLHKDCHDNDKSYFTMHDYFEELYLQADKMDDPRYKQATNLVDYLLKTSQGETLLHGDMHYANIMNSDRGWLAIDPKGLWGEPIYDLANFFNNPESMPDLVSNPDRVNKLADVFSAGLGYDRNRILQYAAAHMALNSAWHLWLENPDRAKRSIDNFEMVLNILEQGEN